MQRSSATGKQILVDRYQPSAGLAYQVLLGRVGAFVETFVEAFVKPSNKITNHPASGWQLIGVHA